MTVWPRNACSPEGLRQGSFPHAICITLESLLAAICRRHAQTDDLRHASALRCLRGTPEMSPTPDLEARVRAAVAGLATSDKEVFDIEQYGRAFHASARSKAADVINA